MLHRDSPQSVNPFISFITSHVSVGLVKDLMTLDSSSKLRQGKMIEWVAISLVMVATVATMATLEATAPVPGALVVLPLRMSEGQAKAGCCYSANSGLIMIWIICYGLLG